MHSHMQNYLMMHVWQWCGLCTLFSDAYMNTTCTTVMHAYTLGMSENFRKAYLKSFWGLTSLTGTVLTCLLPSFVLLSLGRSLRYNPDLEIVNPKSEMALWRSSRVFTVLNKSSRRLSPQADPIVAISKMVFKMSGWSHSILGRPGLSRNFRAEANSGCSIISFFSVAFLRAL